MRNKLAIIILISLCLLTNKHSFSQSRFSKACPVLREPITDAEAIGRKDFFERIKNKGIFLKMKRVINVKDFILDATTIKDVLNIFATSTKNYDGLRIYIILSNTATDIFDERTLYLALVPTEERGDDDDGTKMSVDDESNMYVITKMNTLLQVTTPDQSRQVSLGLSRYITKAVPRIEKALEKDFNIKFNETHSLWFRKQTLFDDTDDRSLLGLLKNIDCGIDKVGFDFASWNINTIDNRFSFKTDILFEMISSKSGESYFLKSFDIGGRKKLDSLQKELDAIKDKKSKEYKEKVLEIQLSIQASFADTAIPCPPAKCP